MLRCRLHNPKNYKTITPNCQTVIFGTSVCILAFTPNALLFPVAGATIYAMYVRFATINDLEACLHLDATFETRRVWQLDLREAREQVSVLLRTTPVPRELRVDYLSPNDALLMHWQRGYCIMVAEHEPDSGVVGYLDVGPEPDLQTGWLWHLVVERNQRRRGIGSLLLRAALQWSSDHQLRRLMVPLQTQNDPGVRFLQRHGFTFCGFNDRYYHNGSVALFFGRDLR